MNKKLAMVWVPILLAVAALYYGIGLGFGSLSLEADTSLRTVYQKFEDTAPVLRDLCKMRKTRLDCGGTLDPLVQEKNKLLKKYDDDPCYVGVRFTLWVHDPLTGPELATAQAVDLCWPARI